MLISSIKFDTREEKMWPERLQENDHHSRYVSEECIDIVHKDINPEYISNYIRVFDRFFMCILNNEQRNVVEL